MAYSTTITGGISEMTAAIALMANGWEVAFPSVNEVYDLVARDPKTNTYIRVQVKTIRRRTDRRNERVVYATKGNGEAYTTEEVDYIIGVAEDAVYMFGCENKTEYWASDSTVDRKWTKLSVTKTQEAV